MRKQLYVCDSVNPTIGRLSCVYHLNYAISEMNGLHVK